MDHRRSLLVDCRRQAGKAATQITVRNTGGIKLWIKSTKDMAHIGVQDTGVGIPADKLQSVFKKFETIKEVRDKVSKAVPGSGLGLNIVLNSIKAQGGRVWVESAVGKGSAFQFTLAFSKEKSLPASAPAETHAPKPVAPKAADDDEPLREAV